MKFSKFERKMAELALDIKELEQAKVKPDNDYEKIMIQLYEDEIIGYLESVKNTIRDLHKTPAYCGIVHRCNDGYYVGDHKLEKYETIEFITYSLLDDEKEDFGVIDDDFLSSVDIDISRYDNDSSTDRYISPIDRYIHIFNDVDPEQYFLNARIGKVKSDFTIRTDCGLSQRDLDGVLVMIRR